MNRERDEHGCPIGDSQEKAMTFDEAANHVARLEDKPESEIRKEAEQVQYPINDMSSRNRMRYLENAIRVCNFRGREKYAMILAIKLQMANMGYGVLPRHKQEKLIVKGLRQYGLMVKREQIRQLERDAIKFVKDEIQQTIDGKKGLVPIVGG